MSILVVPCRAVGDLNKGGFCCWSTPSLTVFAEVVFSLASNILFEVSQNTLCRSQKDDFNKAPSSFYRSSRPSIKLVHPLKKKGRRESSFTPPKQWTEQKYKSLLWPVLSNLGTMWGPALTNAYCQFSQQARTNYDANITYWKMLSYSLILLINLHCIVTVI